MKKLLIFLTISTFCMATNAKQITASQAAETAIKYMPQLLSSKTPLKVAKAKGAANNDDAPYYVFNAGSNGGFVIVSGDDSLTELIGYSDSGHFDFDNMPDNLKSWLATYADYVEKARNGEVAKIKQTVRTNATPVVDSFVTSKWDQGDPYDTQCPYFENIKYYCPTGCVATAMAQIMYYHKLPAQGQGSNAYRDVVTYPVDENNTPGQKWFTHSVDFSKSKYDWDNMLDTYTAGNYTEAQANAVAKLMYDCGVAVNMDYELAASGAADGDISYAFANYFKYKSSLVYRESTMGNEFLEMIKDEMDKKLPVLFCGQGSAGGHAFVIDGYDSNDYIHVNWGWSGLGPNGFYNINLMNPTDLGTGGGAGGFVEMQSITLVEPDSNGTGELGQIPLYFYGYAPYGRFTLSKDELTKGEKLVATVSGILNMSQKSDYKGNLAVGIYDLSGKRMAEPKNANPMNLPSGMTTGATSFDITEEVSKLSDGIYYIYPITKESRSGKTFDWIRVSIDKPIRIVVKGDNISKYAANFTLTMESPIKVGSKPEINKECTFIVPIKNEAIDPVKVQIKCIFKDEESNQQLGSATRSFELLPSATTECEISRKLLGFENGKTYLMTVDDISSVDDDVKLEINIPDEYKQVKFVVGEQAGIENLTADKSVKVYPNPATDIVNVEAASAIRKVSLYSTDGRLVKSSEGESAINVSDCPAGYYIIVVESEEGTTRLPIIKK